jgi:hypothetical protein
MPTDSILLKATSRLAFQSEELVGQSCLEELHKRQHPREICLATSLLAADLFPHLFLSRCSTTASRRNSAVSLIPGLLNSRPSTDQGRRQNDSIARQILCAQPIRERLDTNLVVARYS